MENLLVPTVQLDDKHETMLKTFDGLGSGESMLVINDHDPLLLYSQIKSEKENFEWNTIQDGPTVWKVQITKSLIAKAPEKEGALVGDLVAQDLRTAEIFSKYGIDYCCGGRRKLEEVCLEMNIDYDKLKNELANVAGVVTTTNNYEDWSPAFLADYIYNQHHKYFYRADKEIKELMCKVVGHHGINHPFLAELQKTYTHLSIELNDHFVKEEQQIFPSIRVLDYINITGQKNESPMVSPLATTIQAMENDHDNAGKLLLKLRGLSGGFIPPADACNSFKLLYNKLNELEKDLHLHIHLENNILFPAALRVEEEVTLKNTRK